MQTYQAAVGKPAATEILSTSPRTGHFSIYAQKLSAQIFVWLASFVVWGNVLNEAAIRRQCNVHCGVQLFFGVCLWVGAFVVLMNRPPILLASSGKSSRKCTGACLSSSFENKFSAALILVWIPVVISVSMFQAAPLVAIWFAWLGFFASIYATYKGYHLQMEEEEELTSELRDEHAFDSKGYLDKTNTSDILALSPYTGHFSIYAQKLAAQAFIWLASVIVWGNVVNDASIRLECGMHCGFQVAFGVFTWLLVSGILILNHLAHNDPLRWRTRNFSHAVEAQLTGLLAVFWLPVVISVSTFNSAPVVATWFAWLGFLASVYATYKAYHSFKEEDLPSDLPDGFDEEEYVYG